MKRIFIFLLFLMFCFCDVRADIFSSVPTSSGSALPSSKSSYNDEVVERVSRKGGLNLVCGSPEEPIRVVGFMNYPPFGWKETSYVKNVKEVVEVAQYFGVGMEIFKDFTKKHNLHFSFVNMLNYKEAKYALSLGHFDVMVTDFFDPNGYKNVGYFYPGYVANPIVIVTLKSNAKKFQNLDDLVGKTGYVRKEENFYEIFKSFIPSGVNIKQISGPKRAFYDLLKKKVDFILMSRYAFEVEARRFKVLDTFVYSKPVFSPYVFMSYSKNSRCAYFIKNLLEKNLKKYESNDNLTKSVLVKYLDIWQKKFENERSLLFETGIPEEEVEQETENLDAWLQQQRKEEDNLKATNKGRTKVGL